MAMQDRICAFLEKNPGTKARTIASRLGVDRVVVNRLLHENKDKFQQSSDFDWYPMSTCLIEFGGDSWLTSGDFEGALAGLSPLRSDHRVVTLVLKNDCRLLLEFLARLLALCNQLAESGKAVTLDLKSSRKTLTYLDRVGFFSVLASGIAVIPKRPRGELARAYKGNNSGVIEFRFIDPTAPDQEIPGLLQDSFVKCAGDSYSQAAFTVLAELFGNVLDHSGSAGFACLQFYPRGNSIQTVISDNGLGIVGTLAPVIPQKYPQLAQRIAAAKHAGVALLSEVFSRGEISQVDAKGRGLGLKRSGEVAKKYRAKISVRQSDFELCVHHNPNGVWFTHQLGLAHLNGTHICFEFKLDSVHNSA